MAVQLDLSHRQSRPQHDGERRLICITGANSRVYLNGSLDLNLAPKFRPAFEDQILILTSTTAVVTSTPFASFTKIKSDIVYDILYNVGGNNVIITHIAPANLGVMICIL